MDPGDVAIFIFPVPKGVDGILDNEFVIREREVKILGKARREYHKIYDGTDDDDGVEYKRVATSKIGDEA
jgi:hypothetical protein